MFSYSFGPFLVQELPHGIQTKPPPKSMHQNLTSQKPHAEFPNYKNFPESIK